MDFDEEAARGRRDSASKASSCLNFWRGDAEIVTKSDYLPVYVVASYRTVALGFSLYTLFRYSLEKQLKFDFLTVWTLVGVCCAFFVGACSATSYSLTLKSFSSVFYHVFTSASLLSTIFYWWLVYPGTGITWARIYPHGIALTVLVVDILFLSRMEFRPWHILILLGYLLTYLGFMFIRLAITQEYTYDFLDHRTNSARSVAIYYVAVFFGAIACGLLVLLLSRVSRIFRKREHHDNHQHEHHENKLMELDK